MTKRPRRGNRQKKTERFATLRKRRAQQSALYAALEHKRRDETVRLQAARRRCVKTTGHPKVATIDRRRKEYLEIPAVSPPLIPPRKILTSLAVVFAVPLVLAIAGNIHLRPTPMQPPVVQTRAQRPQLARAQPTLTIHGKHLAVAATAPRPSQPILRPQAPQQAVEPAPQPVKSAQRRTEPASVQTNPQAQAVVSAPQPLALAPQPIAPEPSVQAVSLAPASQATPPAERPILERSPAVQSKTTAIRRQSQGLWTLTPDGTWTTVVHAPGMSSAEFTASTGQIIALERSALDGEAATVTVGWSRAVVVTISSASGTATKTLLAPADDPAAFAATARAVGPHLVNIGWTPLAQSAGVADYKVYRSSGYGDDMQLVAELPAIKHSWHDLQVGAQASYRYDIIAETTTGSVDATTETVTTLGELPVAPASVLAGKGMFLYFSSLDNDVRFFKRYDPEAVIAEAQKANIRVIELRMARGSCAMAQTSQAHLWLNRLVDAAARANISLIAWTVPRRVTTQDVTQTIAAGAYTTPAGNGFSGLALDLETGDHYMGSGAKATASLVQYIKTVRSAVGPHYLIVATVASPGIGNHTNQDYPYAKIAAFADVLQPMEYWHYFYETAHHEYVRREVAGAAAKAVARTRELAGRDIPVNVAGQSVDLEGTGAPSGREIMWSLNGAKSAGGIGETFFDWAGTRPDAWAAIQAFDW